MDEPNFSQLMAIGYGQTLKLGLYVAIVTNTGGLSLLIPSVRKGLSNSLKPFT